MKRKQNWQLIWREKQGWSIQRCINQWEHNQWLIAHGLFLKHLRG